MTREQWTDSTEGDLDPDLTEEAGYMGWEPAARPLWGLVYRAGLALALIALIASALAVFLR